MNTNTGLFKKIFILIFLFSSIAILIASDLSDAETLRKKCELEIKRLEIPVKNFGDDKDLNDYNSGVKLLKLGKVKMAQTKYLDAKAKYNEFLKLQNKIYKSLAKKYLSHTQVLIDDIAVDLVDFLDDKKIDKYLKLASQYYSDAKTSMTREFYAHVVSDCRNSKKYALGCYEAAGKKIPEKYKKHVSDNNKKIY